MLISSDRRVSHTMLADVPVEKTGFISSSPLRLESSWFLSDLRPPPPTLLFSEKHLNTTVTCLIYEPAAQTALNEFLSVL